MQVSISVEFTSKARIPCLKSMRKIKKESLSTDIADLKNSSQKANTQPFPLKHKKKQSVPLQLN